MKLPHFLGVQVSFFNGLAGPATYTFFSSSWHIFLLLRLILHSDLAVQKIQYFFLNVKAYIHNLCLTFFMN